MTAFTPTPADILGAPAGRGQRANMEPSGNSPWAETMATEVRRVVRQASAQSPRTLQRTLGPSEIGSVCDRQVVGKLVNARPTNTIADPWPSVVGTAVHAWLADAFELDNLVAARREAERLIGSMAPDDVQDSALATVNDEGYAKMVAKNYRWHTEQRVTPLPERLGGHPGTADLYDEVHSAVLDHKCLGETSMNKVRRGDPPLHYIVQLGLYGMGYLRAGYPVERVAIIAYPRTGSSLDGVYVWEHAFDRELAVLILTALEALQRRKIMAESVLAGQRPMSSIPIVPTDDCFFCPFYRFGQATDNAGCAGRPQLR